VAKELSTWLIKGGGCVSGVTADGAGARAFELRRQGGTKGAKRMETKRQEEAPRIMNKDHKEGRMMKGVRSSQLAVDSYAR